MEDPTAADFDIELEVELDGGGEQTLHLYALLAREFGQYSIGMLRLVWPVLHFCIACCHLHSIYWGLVRF